MLNGKLSRKGVISELFNHVCFRYVVKPCS